MTRYKKSILLSVLILLMSQLAQAVDKKTLIFAAAERVPYIGSLLPNQGYVNELLTEVYKRSGYETEVQFYPLARARLLAENGKVDGLVPSYYINGSEKNFVFSSAFPGDNIGLLKLKSLPVSFSKDTSLPLHKALINFEKHTFGLVRGSSASKEFDKNTGLKKQFVIKDLQNLDKLEVKRINFVVIDKYTAADLMVNKRPHLIGLMEFIEPLLASNAFHISFSKKSEGYEEHLRAFNFGLAAITADGTLDNILEKHGLFPSKVVTKGKVKLTIGTVNNHEMIIMQTLSKEFEKTHPNIELQWRILDEHTLRQRLLSDLAISDGQFDIMTIGAYEAPIWAKMGWLTALDKLPESYDLEDLLAPIREALSYDDTLYALPFYGESSMTFYRKDLFQKAGISMSKQPTYDDIKTYAAAIHNPDEQVYGICLRGKAGWGENMALISTMVNVYGGQWFDINWIPRVDTLAWDLAISTYRELLVNYGPPNPVKNGFNENRQLFAGGHCGIWIDATVAAGMLFNSTESKVHEKVGFAPAPIASTDKGASWLWSWAFAVPNSSKHKKEAIQFITWATSKGYIQQVAQKYGWEVVPPGTRKSTYENPQYQSVAPFSEFVLQAIEEADQLNSTLKPKLYTGIQFVGIPEFPAIGGQIGERLEEVIKGNVSIVDFLRDAQKLAEDQMDKSGYYQ